ncbi:carbohydrate-binding module family 13 protein [Macrolepiota fuliginosa MF-IS2]|uniref:Carbohydrate-binding module family 13 protein n=1 Tax=Macrolepiota fuliginosa MF-IS2 TaxID=1400762 RepID=A0A9P5XDD7_9AGAR|nr:carbohydrate-binding module family 13 protein [Macrolepiota fuliginosa MF-IS2]
MKFFAQASIVTLVISQVALGAFTEIRKTLPGGPKCNPGIGPKCLDVRGAQLQNGTPVQIFDCNRSNAQDWEFRNHGTTSIRLRNTSFCLDAGSHPANGVKMKIWQCFNNLPAQTWRFTPDSHVVLQNTALCLDLTNGDI